MKHITRIGNRTWMMGVMLAGVVLAVHAADAPGVAHAERWPQAHSNGLVDAQTEAKITALMARMSLEEKVGQMIQADIDAIKPEDLRKYPLGSILAGGNSAPLGTTDERAPAQAWLDSTRAFRAVSLETRPGHVPIPVIFGIDSVHGNNNVVGATIFPHNIALGATRDAELVERIGAATAQETAVIGADWAFGPTLAVPQDLRWGRSYEGYAENPVVVRSYADAVVRGLQGAPGAGNLLQAGHVAASAKHFLGDGGTLGGVDQGDAADVSEAQLIKIHAAGYPPAIEAGVMTIMASYSSWQGQKMHGNASLLTSVLKQRFGFDGFVVGDWNGHGQLPGCTKKSCPQAINAGVDMFMAPDGWKRLFVNTVNQARAGVIAMTRIDDAVRRILRVKFKLGLFENQRPFEGRFELLGASEHRALAREAVRKSLVLLKNNGSVLPIKGNAKVLVVGAGADDIGMQSGGWTLSWQGTGNKNSDFPKGQSIYAALREALTAAGGVAELSTDGSFRTKPDIAVAVIGETPYAEFMGDVPTLQYHAGDQQDLALLKKLKAQGIPVVTVFLSARPIWVNPELNASDAFVAAWQPGTEGGGVADVLIGDAQGRARHDFTGKLSFSWPNTALPVSRQPAEETRAALFAYGYGLNYRSRDSVAQLSEVPGVTPAQANVANYLIDGHSSPPWSLTARSVTQSIDARTGYPQFAWSGGKTGAVAMQGPSISLARKADGNAALSIIYRLDTEPTAPVRLALGCRLPCGPGLDVTAQLQTSPPGQWRTLVVKLADLRDAGVDISEDDNTDQIRPPGADFSNVTQPLLLTTSGRLNLTLRTVRLIADPTGAAKLPVFRTSF